MTREVVYGILNDDQRKRFENNQQLDFAYAIPGVARFRVNCFFQRGTVSAAFRLVPQEIPALDSLGVPQVLRELTAKPRGFVLVTGPTGSGKSTTLAAMIDVINVEHQDHILTIEDPIEFLHQHKSSIVNQREIGSDAPDFALGLRAALREDPDVILVGEMRDLETISTALTAAETGHLVFATLHTQSTAQTVDRIIDVFPPEQQGQVRTQLSIALQGIVTQQLLPTVDGRGRTVATEVLIPTPAIRNLIREGKTHQIYAALQTSGAVGMQTMDADLARLVRTGKISRSLAEQRASVPEELNRLLGGPPAERGGGGDGDRQRPAADRLYPGASSRCRRPPSSSAPWTWPGPPPPASSRPNSKAAVGEQLRQRGLIVLDVSEKSSPLNIEDFFKRWKGVDMRELAIFSRQFATLIASGMPMLRTLQTLEEQTQDDQIREAAAGIRADVEAGSSLEQAMERYPKVFDRLFRAMVRSGEQSGRLDEAMDRIAYQVEKADALKRQVKSALMYPALIFGFATVVLIAIVAFVIPVFAKIFEELAEEHPEEATGLPAADPVLRRASPTR